MKIRTFYFDNDNGHIILFSHDRTQKNLLADTKGEAVGCFVKMLIDTLDILPNGATLEIVATKNE
jgi:hypothetical protein